jgi:hypothetical protein
MDEGCFHVAEEQKWKVARIYEPVSWLLGEGLRPVRLPSVQVIKVLMFSSLIKDNWGRAVVRPMPTVAWQYTTRMRGTIGKFIWPTRS